MIHIYEAENRLLISRSGRLTSVPMEESNNMVTRMLMRLENEGRITRHNTADQFRQAHHQHLLLAHA